MGKKKQKKIQEITNGMSEKCQIAKSSYTPSGKTILDPGIDDSLLVWPKLKMKVPPIFLHKPVDFQQHVRKVLNLGIKFYQPDLGKSYTKIVCETFNDHKYMVQYLDKKQLPYHTFGHPTKMKTKVVIKGLPNDIDINIVKAELKSVSIPVIRVHKMEIGAERRDKTMLVLVVVPCDDEGKKITKLLEVLGHKVKLEPPAEKPMQCYRCQKWGHSQRYCHGQVKCVKCAAEHWTKKCEKAADVEPKCANCGEAHTASYRKCVIAEQYNPKIQPLIKYIPRPLQLVTVDNCDKLYRNINYNKKESKGKCI